MMPDHGLQEQPIECMPLRRLEATHRLGREHAGHQRTTVIMVRVHVWHRGPRLFNHRCIIPISSA